MYLFYHIRNINEYKNINLFKIINKIPLNYKSLKLLIPICIALMRFYFLIKLFKYFPNSNLALFCRASLFYAYHNSLLSENK